MAVILRDVPEGLHWGWYAREDGRMHLRDLTSVNSYKVWLEAKGTRIVKADRPMPTAILRKLKAELARKRQHIEGCWIISMIEQGWLDMRMRGTRITLSAYPNLPRSRFTRSVDLKAYLPGIGKEPVRPEQVFFSSTHPYLEIRSENKLRHHIFLPTILWKD
jgi:hypothetical protein